MDIGLTIISIPGWAMFCLFIVISVLTAQMGAWLAQRLQRATSETEASISSTATSAMLGLLAFILGFTFSITSSRFADRKQLVIDQANAIGTSYLRTSWLPEMQKRETRKLFREYADILVQLYRSTNLEKDITRIDKLHSLIWNQTTSLTQENMDSQLRSLFISSVNNVIDLYTERKTVAFIFRIPDILWISLLSLFLLSTFSLGFQSNSQDKKGMLDIPLLAASFALVIILIADMDSATSARNFKVSQQPLIELQQIIDKDSP